MWLDLYCFHSALYHRKCRYLWSRLILQAQRSETSPQNSQIPQRQHNTSSFKSKHFSNNLDVLYQSKLVSILGAHKGEPGSDTTDDLETVDLIG